MNAPAELALPRSIRGGRVTALCLAIVAGLAFGCHHLGIPDEAEPATAFRVLSPLDTCRIKHGPIHVIARGPSAQTEPPILELDGEPARWQSFEAPVFAADLPAGTGLHTVRVGERTFQVMVGEPPEGEQHDWPHCAAHPRPGKGSRDCAACHETALADGRVRLGPVAGYTVCQPCHREKEFTKTHHHPPKPDERCAQCHAVHGTTRKHLLADKRD
ncbi:MAG TPA: hypothetical protein PLO37_01470 [Candidatus Hydrogenedentes bacterium]|nr:hypothetical protein [Candidatus Hydrogenedentota bacterium]HPG65486.1 hypothetical protein [Candidatus Hydrogenedentota bacterium]